MIESVLYFREGSFDINGVCAAHINRKELVQEAAAKARGHTLEVGFGHGLSHAALHANPLVTSIVVIEKHQEVLERFKTCDCLVVVDDYCEATIDDTFNTIFIDVHCGDVPASIQAAPLLNYLAPDGHFIIFRQDKYGENNRFEVHDATTLRHPA